MTTKEVRDEIIQRLRKELLGPAPGFPAVQLSGEEILRPRIRRVCVTAQESCSPLGRRFHASPTLKRKSCKTPMRRRRKNQTVVMKSITESTCQIRPIQRISSQKQTST